MTAASETPPVDRTRTVLVLGAGGFIGGFIAAALTRDGWRVRAAVRVPRRENELACDLTRMLSPADWLPLLQDVDAVVNAAGILRESGRQGFDAIHRLAPLALAQACNERGINRFVQISALGDPADGEFIASKHRFDSELLACLPSALVLRPSVVYSAAGSYGGTSLLRALASTPGMLPLPGSGQWRIQPLAAEDLGALVTSGLQRGARGIHEVGGPEAMTLRAYQLSWRTWMGVAGSRVLKVPEWLINLQTTAADWLGRGPMGKATWRMLRRGNVLPASAAARIQESFGFLPRSLAVVLAGSPSQVQDRWQAQLYLLAPLLKWSVIALWLLSGMVGFTTAAVDIQRLATGSLLAELQPVLLARATAALDLALAVWLAVATRPRLPILMMLVSVLAYTLAFGILLPALWWDPLGGLAKNMVVLPALAALWIVSERR